MSLSKVVFAAALLVAPLLGAHSSASAATFAVPNIAVASPQHSENLTPVQWRRGGWGGRGYYYGGPRYWGGGAAILGGVIVGSAIVAAAIAENRASASAVRACSRDFRSFDRGSGTYIDRNGDARVCPYLY